MSIKTKIAALAIASLTAIGGLAVSSNDAQAKWKKGHGFGVGLAAGALIGAGIAGAYASGPHYVGHGHRHCRWVRQYDQFGYYIGRTRVCSYPVY